MSPSSTFSVNIHMVKIIGSYPMYSKFSTTLNFSPIEIFFLASQHSFSPYLSSRMNVTSMSWIPSAGSMLNL